MEDKEALELLNAHKVLSGRYGYGDEPFHTGAVDESIKKIRESGVFPPELYLKSFLLRGLGIAPPKPTAKNLIKFSCYMPFLHPRYMQGFFRLMDLLGVEYTYLEKEYCCGNNTIGLATTDEERDRALQASQEFMQIERDGARNKGADTIVYMCAVCCHVGKAYFPEEADRHVYSWEVLMDRLEEKAEEKALKVKPTVAGYMPGGCLGTGLGRERMSALMKRQVGGINWGRFSRLMRKIEGLTLVDLGKGLCCTSPHDNPGKKSIVQEAIDKGLDTIITPSHLCRLHLFNEANGRLQVKYFSDILLPALLGETAAWELSASRA